MKQQVVELFGKRLRIVKGDGMTDCQLCALSDFCSRVNEMAEDHPDWNYPTICQDAELKEHRYFVDDIKPRQWKPTEVQLESLRLALYGQAFRLDELRKLYEQLKAL